MLSRMRQQIFERAGAGTEGEDVDWGSYCTPIGQRWRAEQKLSCGEPFDDMHGSAAGWAIPE
jgi:hypothetical protein